MSDGLPRTFITYCREISTEQKENRYPHLQNGDFYPNARFNGLHNVEFMQRELFLVFVNISATGVQHVSSCEYVWTSNPIISTAI